jgi:phosphatidylglycerophosphate synthase
VGIQPRDISEKSARLRAAARTDDGFFSTFVLRKISRIFTNALVETSIKPNTITLISIIFGLLAAYIAAQGKYLVAAITFLFSLILDCVDGEIARYKGEYSPLGAWLDALADRAKEFAYIAGLIISTSEAKVWWLGMALVILQTLRHLSDYNFVKLQSLYEEKKSEPIRGGIFYWIKKVINLPIGERWLLLALLPLLTSVSSSLRALIYLGIISFLYVLFARARRIRKWTKKSIDVQFLVAQRDTLLPLKISASPIAWSIPSVIRGFEFFLLIATPLNVSPGVRFSLLASVALWHYTNLYDALQGRSPWMGVAGLKVLGRVAICILAYAIGLDWLVVPALACYLVLLIVLRGGHNALRGSK